MPKLKDTEWAENEKAKYTEKNHADCTFKPKTLDYQGTA